MDSKCHTQINLGALERPNKKVPSNLPVLDRGPVAVIKEARRPDTDNINPATRLKHPKLLAALNSRTKAPTAVKYECSWEKYEKNYDFRLFVDGDRVIVAEVKDPWSYDVSLAELRRPSPFVVTVRSFPAHKAEEKLRMLQRIQHENIVSVREIFNYEQSFHVIFEHGSCRLLVSFTQIESLKKHKLKTSRSRDRCRGFAK
jgi:hypothetical protein